VALEIASGVEKQFQNLRMDCGMVGYSENQKKTV